MTRLKCTARVLAVPSVSLFLKRSQSRTLVATQPPFYGRDPFADPAEDFFQAFEETRHRGIQVRCARERARHLVHECSDIRELGSAPSR